MGSRFKAPLLHRGEQTWPHASGNGNVCKGGAHCTQSELRQSLLWQMGPSEEGQ